MTRDEAYIAQRSGANQCVIVPASDKTPCKGQYVMAIFGTTYQDRQHYAFYCKYPLVHSWQEKIIKAILSKKRERA